MKTRGMMIVALAMAAALMAAPAVAQTINLRADVPFNFVAGDVLMNSGRCSLHSIIDNVVQLSDADNHSTAAILTRDDLRSATDTKLVFHRYGDRYFLAWVKTPEASYKVPISRREMKLARQTPPQQIAVLAHPAAAGK